MLGPVMVVVVAGLTTAAWPCAPSDALVNDDYYKRGKIIELTRDNEAVRLKMGAQVMFWRRWP